jgi:MFS family permease
MAKAYSWTNISWLIGSTVAPFLGGVVADLFGIRFPFFACSILIFAVFPLTLLMQETRKKPQSKAVNDKNKKVDMIGGYLIAVILFELNKRILGVPF